jgi:hypothetical protein
MADIELVIKIPEDSYRSTCNGSMLPPDVKSVVQGIKNGTPLPKGHGRIADMDEAIKCIEDVEGEDAIWAVNLIEWACSKRTIIEADKEN